ncbi:MAG TPA: TMEM175 family protein, partial [Candidatus Saccharimonadia bacterium]
MEIERIPKSRVESFSDGVMAIVLTLLAFRLKTPDLSGRSNWHQYLQALVPLVPTFISFALSFTMVALY